MKSKRLTTLLLLLGVLLILGTAGWFGYMRYSIHQNAKYAAKTVKTLYSLMPAVTDGAPDGRANAAMSAIEVDGLNFVAVIEIPAYDRKLPVYGSWERDSVSRFPCRYLGSMHDGTLIIGGSDNDGQFDCMKQIAGGDWVQVTDTLGVRYTYRVSDIRRTKDVSTENLCRVDAELTLFCKNSLDFDYTVVYCHIAK